MADKVRHIAVVAVGGGTATRDVYMTPKNANYYIGAKGVKTTERSYSGTAYDGRTIGGGLLIIYANSVEVGENGTFDSFGKTVNGSSWSYKDNSAGIYHSGGAGGGSGGGSINIFYMDSVNGMDSSKFNVITGSYSPKGTYNVGTIKSGIYESLLITQ